MKPSRRSFIGHAAAAGAALPLFNIRKAGAAPLKTVNHASFGAGGMAFADISRLARSENFNLVAVAEVDSGMLEKVQAEFPHARIYRDWRELLDREHWHLDSVNVSVPDHMHAPIAVSAMNLGLHVYGQKPLGHTLYETRRMAEIARQKGLVTQMGTQLTSSTYERLVVRMVQDGVIGKVKEVHIFSYKTWGDPLPLPDQRDPVPDTLDWDLWCGAAPKPAYIGTYAPPGTDPAKAKQYYHPKEWRRRLDYGTGTLGDMGCHLYSPMFAAMALKAPLSVKSVGGVPNATNWAVDEQFEYVFPGNRYSAGETLNVTWYDGAKSPPSGFKEMFGDKMPDQGSIFVGTEGTLLAPLDGLPVAYPLEKYTDYSYPKFPARDHWKDFVNAVRGEEILPLADFHRFAGPLTETVLLGALASRFPNETLEWDPESLRFTNSEAANAFIRKEYRDGWEVDGLA